MVRRYVITVILGLSILLTAYIPSQKEFTILISFYSLAMGSYAMLIRDIEHFPLRYLTILWGVITTALLFSFPNFSDDIYRFYWDGMIVDLGISPYHHLPSELINNGLVDGSDVFSSINSKNYYSVYPPFNQVMYWASYKLSSGIFSFSVILKIIYFLITCLGFYYIRKLLSQMGIPINNAFIFFLNPLVLIEGMGNLHIEIVVMSFLAAAFYYYHTARNRWMFSLFYVFSFSIKLVPLLIAPFLWFRQAHKWRLKNLGWIILLSLLFFFPIFIGAGQKGFLSSIDLYFRKFEFNGGVYYILRYLGFQLKGYNLIAYIGPALGAIVFITVVFIAIVKRKRNTASLINYSLIAWTIYLCLSTTVHPWYIIPIIFFGIFNRSKFPIVWSYLIMWTYINYSYAEYHENLLVVTMEYLIVVPIIIYELLPLLKEKA